MTSGARNASRVVRGSPRDVPSGALALIARRSSEARERLGTWTETLARQTREHPVRSVAVALGVGFLLGGGLFSRLTFRIVSAGARIGLRMAVVPLMAQGLVALEEGLLSPRPPAVEVGDHSSDPASDPASDPHHAHKTRRPNS
jgi:hypothetical protein